MKHRPTDLTQPPRRQVTPKQRALVAFLLSVAGIAAGLFFFIPQLENVGVLFTMACAVLAGIYMTRYQKLRREERKR